MEVKPGEFLEQINYPSDLKKFIKFVTLLISISQNDRPSFKNFNGAS